MPMDAAIANDWLIDHAAANSVVSNTFLLMGSSAGWSSHHLLWL